MGISHDTLHINKRAQTNSLSIDENLNFPVVDSIVAPVAVLKKTTRTQRNSDESPGLIETQSLISSAKKKVPINSYLRATLCV